MRSVVDPEKKAKFARAIKAMGGDLRRVAALLDLDVQDAYDQARRLGLHRLLRKERGKMQGWKDKSRQELCPMEPMIDELKIAYTGMSTEEVLMDMQESGADTMFADSWMVANYIVHLASSAA